MEQKKKNIRLLYILIALIIVSIAIYIFPEQRKSTISNVDLFQIQDTAAIDRITISSANLNNNLIRTDSGWVINNKYRADENIMMVLNTVMKKVEVLRPLPQSQKSEFIEKLNQEGLQVAFYADDEKIKSFVAGANEMKSMSIFKGEDEELYVVNIPGYDSFVTGIFEITEIDWKNRLIVNALPLELNQLKVNYVNDDQGSFTVNVEDNFPTIENTQKLDTLALMDYLDQFQYFQADRFVNPSGEKKYDSLSSKTPFVEFSFDNFNDAKDISIQFFSRLPGDQMILGVTSDGEKALFNYNRISGIFKKKGHFEKREKAPRPF